MEALRLKAPALPLANAGYAIGLPARLGGGMVCGATSHVGDTCKSLRIEDHLANLAQADVGRKRAAASLTEEQRAAHLARLATGRVGWRQVSADRLPLVGPVPAARAGAMEDKLRPRKLEQARHVPRVEGLYVLCALGSRGITLAPLLGQTLASWVTGWPQPVGADLLDAMDPARFFSKRLRSLAKAV
jgi:tRNA 5-methylaminomethyl-2-thiouridine biosynthesis bifunctional protein